jgi:small ligand-binding sensory domain FIST
VLQADLPTFFRSAPETIPETIRVALRDRVPGPKERDPAFVIRRLIGVDPRSGEMAIGDEAPEGSACALAVRDPVAAREAVDGGALGLGREEPPMAGGLFLAGLGRGHELHGFEGLDLAYLGHRLPSLPIASLEVSMTFAPLADRNRFHLEAGTFIGFGPGALSSIPPDR